MKHNSTVYVDAYFQMGRSFVQLLTRIIAFDNLCLSLENKCLIATNMSLEMCIHCHYFGVFTPFYVIIQQNYVLGQKNIHQT